MKLYIGLHHPSDAKNFTHSFISVNTIRTRKSSFGAKNWIMDSGAFTEISNHGDYRTDVANYARIINRWADDPGLVAAVAQDYMCEPFILTKTGLTIVDHQRLTIERFDKLVPLTNVYVMPVVQGFKVRDYLAHIDLYGNRLDKEAYVGVGSLCKRNTDVASIEHILLAIKHVRPDLRLHGFGLKITALASGVVRDCLTSADSMAWSYAARKKGRNGNDWHEAAAFESRIKNQHVQCGFGFMEDEPTPRPGLPEKSVGR